MKDVLLDYGDGKMPVELPDTATVVQYGKTYTDPPAVDPAEAVRNALKKPLGFPPLRELSGPKKKIVIAFPDRVKGGFHDQAHRKVSIPIIIEELLAGGARIENITLLCAMGLHRQNTLDEWYAYLGKEIVDRFYPGRIVNHDAEAPDLMDFGLDDMGNRVQCNRLIGEADLPIVVGHCAGNPYGGYSGGYKLVVTGLVGWRSTASHHTPGTMHRDDWLGSSTKQHMRKQFASIGQAIERGSARSSSPWMRSSGRSPRCWASGPARSRRWSRRRGPWPTGGPTSSWTWPNPPTSSSSGCRATSTTARAWGPTPFS